MCSFTPHLCRSYLCGFPKCGCNSCYKKCYVSCCYWLVYKPWHNGWWGLTGLLNWCFSVCGRSWHVVAVVSVMRWFAISVSQALICLSASGVWCSNATVVRLSRWFWQLVAMVGVMNGLSFPSWTVLTVSSGFGVALGWDSSITFIVNDGDAGWWGFPQPRRSVAVVGGKVVVVGGAVLVVTGSTVASGGLFPLGYAMAMMSTASFSAAAIILSASAGLLICWFMGLIAGLGYVLNLTCSLKVLSCIIMVMISSTLLEIFLPLNSSLAMLRWSSADPLLIIWECSRLTVFLHTYHILLHMHLASGPSQICWGLSWVFMASVLLVVPLVLISVSPRLSKPCLVERERTLFWSIWLGMFLSHHLCRVALSLI